MLIDNRISTLLQKLPLIAVLGVDADFSRYKYLARLTDELKYKENFVNQYLKDNINIVVYPKKYGEDRYIRAGEKYIPVKNMEKAVSEYRDTIEAIILPGHCLDEDYIFDIPGKWDIDYEFTFGYSLYQIIFVEAFPYGKESFINLLDEAIEEYPFRIPKKVLFYRSDVQYGATDVSLLDDAINNAVSKIKKYVQSWNVFDDSSRINQLKGIEFDLSAQFKRKRLKQIQKQKILFKTHFERDYINESTRFLNIGDEENKKYGILSEQAFQKISDYENVKGSYDVEKKIFSNYLSLLNDDGESIIGLVKKMYDIYLWEFLDMESLEFGNIKKQMIRSIEENYKLRVKRPCPSTSYEYMILCAKENYIVKLKVCVNNSIEKNVHLKTKSDIKQKLEECEAKYL